MKLVKIGIGAGIVVGAAVAVILLQPSELYVRRAATMSAPPAKVFEQVNDFHKWTAWSPWEKVDPNMTRTYSGPETGVGAVYAWSGNNEIGEGRMTIVESQPDLVRIRLEFMRPFAATNTAEFRFVPEGDTTAVSWTMTGTQGFLGKAICLVMNMDTMIGGRFDQGLASLKSIVEAAPRS